MLRILFFLMLFAGFAQSVFAKPPNIVFILADDLSWSDLGCYGNRIHDTPNIDRLAASGMRFTQAYAPAPICSASRAAILTGKSPARLKFEFVTKHAPGRQRLNVPLLTPPFTLNLPLGEVTMGEALAAAGYSTGFFGKWHVNQHYKGYLGWSPKHGPLQQGFAHGVSDFGSHPYTYRSNREQRDSLVPDGQFPDDSLLDQTVKFIHKKRDRPFFLYLSQYFVHDPVHSRCQWLVRKYRKRLPPDALDIQASYGAMVETLDHLVGRTLDSIDQAGLTEHTLVVLTSDNGGHPNYTSNAPLRGSKWNLYEGGIRVPLIVRWPGHISPGSRSDTVVHACDLLPTFCQVAETRLSVEYSDGESLVMHLRDTATEPERKQPLVWHFPYYHPEKLFAQSPKNIGVADFATSQTRPHSAIRSGHWKLLKFFENDRIELYDLKADPVEQNNLATEFPRVAETLHSQLSEYLDNVGARLPTSRAPSNARQ